MKPKNLFRIASLGLFISALILFDYTDFSFESNSNIYVLIFTSILLLGISSFVSAKIDNKSSILYLNVLIALLILFILFNLVLIFRNPANFKPYGWIFVSICFIISYILIKKENLKKLRNN